jgi:hypothetical protein
VALLGCTQNASSSCAQWHLRFAFWLGVLSLFPSLVLAQTTTLSEHQIKAVFIYKFCLYVEWPPGTFSDSHSPVTIGVIDADDIAAELELKSKDRTIDGRPLAVRRLDSTSNLDNLQLLFISQTQQNKLTQWITLAQRYPLLVVTEIPSGLDAGSSINFALQDNRVRFDVGLAATQRRGLKLSAQLLQVARTVREGEMQ